MISKYENKLVFCKTKEEAKIFLTLLQENGYLWASGAKPLSLDYFGATTYNGCRGVGYLVIKQNFLYNKAIKVAKTGNLGYDYLEQHNYISTIIKYYEEKEKSIYDEVKK